mgnify:FL=1
MKRYYIEITFTDGNVVQARTLGRNKNDALKRVKETDQYKSFAVSAIKAINIEAIPIASIDNERFAVTNITNKEGWYVVVDLDNRVKIEFKKGKFNETQQVQYYGKETPDPLSIATASPEIGEFMQSKFSELI